MTTCNKENDSQAMIAAAGMVSTQAHTIFVAMPQRTAFMRWMLPTPVMAPAMAWVVDTGKPQVRGQQDGARGSRLGAESAARFEPRQPAAHGVDNAPSAAQVPSAIAACADRITQMCTSNVF